VLQLGGALAGGCGCQLLQLALLPALRQLIQGSPLQDSRRFTGWPTAAMAAANCAAEGCRAAAASWRRFCQLAAGCQRLLQQTVRRRLWIIFFYFLWSAHNAILRV
jgi:hypothetical protein